MKVVYFFRKPFMHYHHSIEELFGNIMKYMPKSIVASSYVMKWKSKGFIRRLIIAFDVISKQGDVNHITGDIHFIAYFLSKKKTILTIHDLAPLSRGNKIKQKLIKFFWFTIPAMRVKMVTVISESIKKELIQQIPVNENKVVVIHDCISSEIEFQPKEQMEDKPILLHIGTMPNKNIENTVRAIEGLNVRLLILGKLNENHISILKKHQIDYENHFNLEYEQVLDLYRRSDILLFASMYEGFGLPILEANAIGRPVITSNISSMPEVGGDAALYVDPKDHLNMRSGIIKILEDEKLRSRLIQRGLINIRRFSPEAIALKYNELYKQITNY